MPRSTSAAARCGPTPFTYWTDAGRSTASHHPTGGDGRRSNTAAGTYRLQGWYHPADEESRRRIRRIRLTFDLSDLTLPASPKDLAHGVAHAASCSSCGTPGGIRSPNAGRPVRCNDEANPGQGGGARGGRTPRHRGGAHGGRGDTVSPVPPLLGPQTRGSGRLGSGGGKQRKGRPCRRSLP